MSQGIAIRIMIVCEAVVMGIGTGGVVSAWPDPGVFWFGCICCLIVLFDASMTVSTFKMLDAYKKGKRRKNGPEGD